MEEKVLMHGQRYGVNKILAIVLVACTLLVCIITMLSATISGLNYYEQAKQVYDEHTGVGSCGYDWGLKCQYCELVQHVSKTKFITGSILPDLYGPCLVYGVVALVLFFLLSFGFGGYKITVTEERIYGTTAFGKKIDLPLSSISKIGIIKSLKGFYVVAASKKISFLLFKNNEQLFAITKELLTKGSQQTDENTK